MTKESVKPAIALRFVAVGSMGFIINATLLYILHGRLGINLLVGQIISAEVAIACSYSAHYKWTFSDRKGSFYKKMFQYHASAWTGFIINLICLLICVYVFNIYYLTSLAIGAALAMSWNFSWSYLKIWRGHD